MTINITHKNLTPGQHGSKSKLVPVIIALLVVLVIRLVSLKWSTTALFFDEAQYWLWGKEPDFGYFSKPPLLGWIIAVFTQACGSDSEFCVRLPSLVLHTGTAFLIYLTTLRLIDQRTGMWAAITFAILPGISLSSTLISTDVPLLFCWAGALWAFVRLSQQSSWNNAILLGVFLGAGLMAKYAMAYFVLCAVLYAVFDTSARKTVLSWKFGLSLVLALILLSPNLWWNAQHEFITASHTGDNIGWRGGLHPLKALEFLGSQFGVFGPIPFAFYLIALVRFWREGWNATQKFLVLFSLPVLTLITFQGLMSKAYANWAAVTYIAATILVADLLINFVPPLWNRITQSLHMVIFLGLSVAVAFSAPGILTLANGIEPFQRLHGWREISHTVERELEVGDYQSVIGPHRHLTAELVYYLRHRPEKVFAFRKTAIPHDHYEMTRAFMGTGKAAALLVTTSENVEDYLPYFESMVLKGSAEFSAGNIRKLWLFEVKGYNNTLVEGRTTNE